LGKYGKEQKRKTLEKVRGRRPKAHEKARTLLMNMGFKIVEDIDPVSSKPWDFIAKKHGLTFYVDTKNPFTEKGNFIITVSELQGMLKLSPNGVPAYLFIFPDERNILFTAY